MESLLFRRTVSLKKRWIIVGSAIGSGLLLLIGVAGWPRSHSRTAASKSWNDRALTATYVGSKLIELDNAHSSLALSYDLENNTDVDYRLADGPGLVVMARLKSDDSLSQEEPIRLKYPVFLPARQTARIAVEMIKPFAWPANGDPEFGDKLRDFVKQRLASAEGFVLFDDTSHCQVELPGAWEQLRVAERKASEPRR